MLFIGCRNPDQDTLYAKEFQDWAKQGVVDVRYAFSRATDKSDQCKYVQDRLWKDRKEALALWENGGKIFVCGNNEVGEGVREVFIKTSLEDAKEKGRTHTREDAEEYFSKVRNERYASDVFA
jgi:cytochrome P450/NADPH-cytochrome P450 reductase